MYNQNKPEIRFNYGAFLDVAFSDFSKESDIMTPEEVRKKIPLFQEEWKKYEERILKGMCDILNLEFYNQVIDIYLVGAYAHAMSEPLVMSARCNPHLFVDILTHELLHVLLVDNTKKVPIGKIWMEMFPEAIDRKSRNHVVVHAVHKEIYLNVLKAPERLERNLKRNAEWKSYQDSWNIVEKRGHQEIINNFKKYYTDI